MVIGSSNRRKLKAFIHVTINVSVSIRVSASTPFPEGNSAWIAPGRGSIMHAQSIDGGTPRQHNGESYA